MTSLLVGDAAMRMKVADEDCHYQLVGGYTPLIDNNSRVAILFMQKKQTIRDDKFGHNFHG